MQNGITLRSIFYTGLGIEINNALLWHYKIHYFVPARLLKVFSINPLQAKLKYHSFLTILRLGENALPALPYRSGDINLNYNGKCIYRTGRYSRYQSYRENDRNWTLGSGQNPGTDGSRYSLHIASTLHCTLHCTVQCTLHCTLHYTLHCTVQCTMCYTIHCIV